MKLNINIEDENPDGSGGLFIQLTGDSENLPFLAVAVNTLVNVIAGKTGISVADVHDMLKKSSFKMERK